MTAAAAEAVTRYPVDRVHHEAMLRRWAVTDAVALLIKGDYDAALNRMVSSVLGEQARVAGIRAEVRL